MLLNEQAAELLKKCEALVGKELLQIRGNLRKATSRAAAVWELLVIEAASSIGKVEYESHPGGSPDIKLYLPNSGRFVWIEVAYLYPRFWKEERQTSAVTNWLFSEAKRLGIPTCKIYPRFDGYYSKKAGPVRLLPKLNERKIFLCDPVLKKFFNNILSKPETRHICSFPEYTISITYTPNAKGPYLSSGGLAQEAPTTIKEHAVYRLLKEKAKQHNVNDPRIICIGSDQSPSLSRAIGPMEATIRDAMQAIFSKNLSISATIIIAIENIAALFGRVEKQARGEITINQKAKNPLLPEEVQSLSQMNFNQWKYSQPLNKWKEQGTNKFPKVTGTLTWRPGPMSIEVEIPTNVLVDALAGKTTLAEEFNIKEDKSLYNAFNEGWEIEFCSFKKGNIQLGEAPKVVLKLVPPFSVFGTHKKKDKKMLDKSLEKDCQH